LDVPTRIEPGSDTLCSQASVALLALRTEYGLETIEMAAMDRITALRVAATLEFLRNNLPAACSPRTRR
jgi:hypothetical protein